MAVPDLWKNHYKEIVWAFCKVYAPASGVSIAAMYTALLITAQGEHQDIQFDALADIDEAFIRDDDTARKILKMVEDLTINPAGIAPFLREAQRLVQRHKPAAIQGLH